MDVFVSYSKQNSQKAEELRRDIDKLRHNVWVDQKLVPGQVWWDEILQHIRDCDLFVIALTTDWLLSYVCEIEYRYAKALGKTILPIMLGDPEINSELSKQIRLRDDLLTIQYVDYRIRNAESAFSLQDAFQSIQRSGPLPSVLPPDPPVPEPIEARINEPNLSYEDQLVIFETLKRRLTNPENARALLRELRKRDDLAVNVARMIDKMFPPGPRWRGWVIAGAAGILLIAIGSFALQASQRNATPPTNTGVAVNPQPTIQLTESSNTVATLITPSHAPSLISTATTSNTAVTIATSTFAPTVASTEPTIQLNTATPVTSSPISWTVTVVPTASIRVIADFQNGIDGWFALKPPEGSPSETAKDARPSEKVPGYQPGALYGTFDFGLFAGQYPRATYMTKMNADNWSAYKELHVSARSAALGDGNSLKVTVILYTGLNSCYYEDGDFQVVKQEWTDFKFELQGDHFKSCADNGGSVDPLHDADKIVKLGVAFIPVPDNKHFEGAVLIDRVWLVQ